MRYPLIASQLFNTPLMAQPAMAHAFADAFIALLSGAAPADARLAIAEPGAPPAEAYVSRYAGARFKGKPYAMTDSGIGILPVHGAMVQRMGQLTPDCMEMTSYEKLGRSFDAMLADPDVSAILMEIDSPGGQVAGNFEFARRILAARGQKPIYAHANEKAFSAAYSIGSSATQLFTADTGAVGAIGVMMLHMNMAERDAKLGYEYTAFYSGARKNDFNPHFKLSSAARAAATDMVNRLHNVFAQHVASARAMSVDAVNATQSDTIEADAALEGKFIDGIATFAEVLNRLEDSLKNSSQFGLRSSAGRSSVASQTKQEVPMKEFTQQDLDRVRAEGHAAGKAEGVKEGSTAKETEIAAAKAAGVNEGRKAERARFQAINELAEAKTRPAAAAQLIAGTELGTDEAKKFLAGLPEEAKGGFASAMGALKNPVVAGADGETEADVAAMAKQIASYAIPAKAA